MSLVGGFPGSLCLSSSIRRSRRDVRHGERIAPEPDSGRTCLGYPAKLKDMMGQQDGHSSWTPRG